ncbi:MAG: LPS assembly lipoprotein LptE [Pseudomonadales bacterium]|nr:LPS assembly lipoprotein LptE [Pseudomonadales bacterium]
MTSSFRILVVLSLLTLLSACGFALRGSTRGASQLPPQLQTLQLESLAINTDLVREMRSILLSSGITVIDSPQPGVYRLGIGQEQSRERVLSFNANARAGEYELSMDAPFQLRSGTELLLGPETVTVDKVYLADPENAVAKTEEAEQIKAEIRKELVVQIMRRLQTAVSGI